MNNRPLISSLFLLLAFFLLCMSGIILDKPVGSVSGKIAVEQKHFHLYSYDIKSHKVYVLATGPRNGNMQERGAWVNADGTFKINHLPSGEYSLKIHATGYATSYQSGIFIDEGKITYLPHTVELSILEPSVNIASNSRVYTSKEHPRFWINATGADIAIVHLYKTDFLNLVKLSCQKKENQQQSFQITPALDLYKTTDNADNLLKNSTPIVTLKKKLEQDQEDWSHAEFKISQSLPAGDYLAEVEVFSPEKKRSWNMLWFTVSDLGLVVKKDSEKTVVRAIDLNTLQGISGATINIIKRSDTSEIPIVATATTGENGVVQINTKGNIGANQNIIVTGKYGANRAYGGLYSWDNTEVNGYQTYFYTDRPVYRLGQTVCYKGICRTLGASGFHKPQPSTSIKAIIEDPSNNTIWQGKFQTNEHGTFHGTFDIPSDGKTGAYQMTLTYPNGAKEYESFEVAQYRKPEYQVEVTALTPQAIAGQQIKARVKATYYFGAPVKNARVKYSVYASNDWSTRLGLMTRPSYYNYFDDWGTDGLYFEGDSGDFITEGYTQTDDNGEAVVEFDSKKLAPSDTSPYDNDYSDKRYKIQAEVTDLSRMSVIGNGYCSVTEGNFALFVAPQESVIKAGGTITAEFAAISYDKHPVVNQKIALSLSRWIYDNQTYTYKGKTQVAQTIATTDSSGKGIVTFHASGSLPTDSYYLSAKAIDSQGHVIFDQSSIWIASDNYPYILNGGAAEKQALSVKLDKAAYKPGDVAKVMITAPTSGADNADAIVSIEGTRLYSYKLVPMNATAKMIEVPILAEYEPNAFINVTFIGKKHQFYNESETLKVTPQEHFLKVSIDTDKNKYKPGEIVHYKLKATDITNHPVANAEFSLGVVDESIYSIRPETAPNIQKFFYKRRANWVTTICSFPEQYSGGPDKMEPAVRKDFKDTAAWLPELVTNKDGVASADIKLPDNLTTWRATVRGIDNETNVGSCINKIVCTQDLILRLALPRFFTQGDIGAITAIVHNYTDIPQTINLSLSPSPQFQIKQSLNQQIKVAPQKAEQFSWDIKAIEPGQAIILAKAIGQTAADALQKNIPVNTLGTEEFLALNGLLLKDNDSTSIPVIVPAATVAGSAKCLLNISASSIGPVIGNFNTLIDYPYGCTEQTMDRLIPSIVAVRLHSKLGIPIDKKSTDKFNAVYKQSMSKLKDYQHEDGGWGWWESDQSNPYLTSLVMEGFYLLKQANYFVDNDQIAKGKAWLLQAEGDLYKQLSSRSHVKNAYADIDATIDLAKMLYTSTLWGDKIKPEAKLWLIKQINTLPPEALSYMSLTCNKTDKALAQKFYQRLLELANRDSKYIDWDHTKAMQNRFGAMNVYDYSFRFTGVETTALALKAVLAMEPNNTATIEGIKNWLLLQRDKNGWQNTKTTAQVLLVLLDEELTSAQHNSIDYTASVVNGNTNLANMTFDQSNAYSMEKSIPIPLPQNSPGIKITKTGSGRLYYNSLLTYTHELKPGEILKTKSLPEGIKLSRTFFRLLPSAITSDGKIHFHSTAISNSTVSAGETVLMKISIDTPVSLPYVLVEAALPSGGEVVQDSPKLASVSDGGTDESNLIGDWGQWWWNHQDILDDRLVYFITSLPAGKSEVNTMIRMEMPGVYQMNPIHLEGMYTKQVRAFSSLDSIKVTN